MVGGKVPGSGSYPQETDMRMRGRGSSISIEPMDINEPNVRAELLREMRYLRTMSSREHTLRDHLEQGKWVILASRVAMPRETFDNLPVWLRRWALAIAHGKSSTTAVVMGKSAARVHGMWVITRGHEPTELALPSGGVVSRSCRPEGTVYCRNPMSEGSFHRGEWVRVTSPARTVVDIARFHGFTDSLVAADSYLRAGHMLMDLRRELRTLGPVRGKATVERCISEASGESESPYESLARALLISSGLSPIPQFPCGRYRVDLAVDGVAVEIDGDQKYAPETLGRTLREERLRENELTRRGLYVARFQAREIATSPAKFVAEVRSLIDVAANRGRPTG